MNLAFAGTPEFAEVALSALLAAGHRVSLVLTQPDRPAGRGMKLHMSPVKTTAQNASVPVLQPVSLRKGDDAAHAINALRTCNEGLPPDVLIVAAYGLILPQEVLDIPRFGGLNIHASLLPRWRGAAPIHRAIEAGDTETGITIMQMDAGLDTGAMRLVKTLPIKFSDTTASLHDELAALGGQAIVEALDLLEQDRLSLVAQPTDGITYAQKISKNEAWLDWSESADVLARRLRAFDPFPGGVAQLVPKGLNLDQSPLNTQTSAQVLKLWAAKAIPHSTRSDAHGEILSVGPDGLLVECGSGRLLITELQKPGGKRQNVNDVWQHLGLGSGDRFVSNVSA